MKSCYDCEHYEFKKRFCSISGNSVEAWENFGNCQAFKSKEESE